MNQWRRPIRLAFCVVAIGLLGYCLDWRQILNVWAHARGYPLALAFVMIGPSLILLALRMTLLVRAYGLQLPLPKSLLILLAGNSISSLVPAGTIAEDGTRFMLLANAIRSRRASLMAVAADRMFGLAGLLRFPLTLGVCLSPFTALSRVVGPALLVMLVGWMVLKNRRCSGWVVGFVPRMQEFRETAAVLVGRPMTLLAGLLISIVSHAFVLGSLLFAARALGGLGTMDTGIAASFICWTALSLLTSVLPLGVMEWAFAGLLGWSNGIVSPEIAVSIALFGRVAQVIYGTAVTIGWMIQR